MRAGLWSGDCTCSDYEKEQWGCEKATEYAVWSDEDDGFYNCPFHFISSSTFDFIARYDAIKNGWASGLPFDNTLNRFMEAVNIFEGYLRKFEAQKDPTTDLGAFKGKNNG